MIKRIPVDELRTGMYVCGIEKTGGEPLFFMNSILMRSPHEVERFNNNIYAAVYIQIEQRLPGTLEKNEQSPGLAEEPSQAPEEAAILAETAGESAAAEDPWDVAAGQSEKACAQRPLEASQEKEETDFYEELKEASLIRNEAEGVVREFLHSARVGEGLNTEKVNNTVGKMVDSIFRNQDALTSLARLKSFDDYTFAHSVNVCLLSLAIGRHMGLPKDSLQDLGVGSILHDIGKMLVPDTILRKAGGLTEAEYGVMRTHAELGAQILNGTKEIADASRAVPREHHEKYDGTGYPNRLSGADIHLFARIGAVADAYDAMTSNRVYQSGLLPEEALKRMYMLRGKQFDPELVERLIRCLGIYPIGTLVELNTGELAIVKMANHSHPLQPMVMLVFDKDKNRCREALEVDLKNEVGRWIVCSKNAEDHGDIIQSLIMSSVLREATEGPRA